jgi:hypothetical protein
MSTTYPTTKQTFSDPSGTNTLADPDHAGLHTDTGDTVEAIQDAIGTTAGTNILKDFAGGQFPARVNSGGTILQTLTGGTINKSTLGSVGATGGTFTTPIINNSTIGTPAITGGTANNVTLGTPVFSQGAVGGADLSTSAITLGYAEITTPFTTASATAVQVTGLTATVTVPAGGRKVKITAFVTYSTNSGNNTNALTIWDGVVSGGGTQLAQGNNSAIIAGSGALAIAVVTPSAGSKTYNVGLHTTGGTATIGAGGATNPAFLLVELI